MLNKVLKEVEMVIRKHGEIVFAYLYGSVAKGEERKGSDVDIGVFLEKDFKRDVFYESSLAMGIEKETKLKNVEIVVLNGKSLRFLNQVFRYGKLIISKNEKERIKFETSVTKSYIDFKPHYQEYDKLREKRLGL